MKIMTKIFLIGIFLYMSMQAVLTYAQPLKDINDKAVQQAQIIYLAAFTSTGAYNDKLGTLACDTLADDGWQVERYWEQAYTSDAKFILATKQTADEYSYFLAISGTDSWQDVKTDLTVKRCLFSGDTPQAFAAAMKSESLEENSPLVHSGFAQYVQDGFFTKKVNGLTFGEWLLQKLQQPKDKPVRLYITGHSLGGAAAELLAARLISMGADTAKIQVITFGAPAVGNKSFVAMYEPQLNLTRITMQGDPVKNLAQIANTKLVQFKTNTPWKMPEYENDKSTHSVLLYFDRAMHNYYAQLQPHLTAIQAKATAPHTYVAMKFAFPKFLASEEMYIQTALQEMLLRADATGYVFAFQDTADIFAQAQKLGVHKVIIYDFSASRLQDNISPKRYYIHGAKFIYTADGNLLNGTASSMDTAAMTVLQAALYTVEKKTK